MSSTHQLCFPLRATCTSLQTARVQLQPYSCSTRSIHLAIRHFVLLNLVPEQIVRGRGKKGRSRLSLIVFVPQKTALRI